MGIGLCEDRHHARVPPERLVRPGDGVSVFALAQQGLLAPKAQAALQIGPRAYRLAAYDGQIEIDGQPVAVRSHVLGMPVFVCPACHRDCYRLYDVGGAWVCRSPCGLLDYSSRHEFRTVRGRARALWLRKRLSVEQRLFAPLPDYPRHATRKRRLAAEIMAIETRLVGHLRHDVNDVVERRDDDRIDRNQLPRRRPLARRAGD